MGLSRVILLLVSIFATITLATNKVPKTEAEKTAIAEAMRPIGMQPDNILD